MAVVIFTERLELVPLPTGLLEWSPAATRALRRAGSRPRFPRGGRTRSPRSSGSSNSLRIRASSRGSCERSCYERRVGSWATSASTDRPTTSAAWKSATASPPCSDARGYAREAIAGLTDWAFATGEARVCVASVSPRNAGSLALVRSLGFRQVGEQIDELDGLELVFERALPSSPTVDRGMVTIARAQRKISANAEKAARESPLSAHSHALADRRPHRCADETFSMRLSGHGGCRR